MVVGLNISDLLFWGFLEFASPDHSLLIQYIQVWPRNVMSFFFWCRPAEINKSHIGSSSCSLKHFEWHMLNKVCK